MTDIRTSTENTSDTTSKKPDARSADWGLRGHGGARGAERPQAQHHWRNGAEPWRLRLLYKHVVAYFMSVSSSDQKQRPECTIAHGNSVTTISSRAPTCPASRP